MNKKLIDPQNWNDYWAKKKSKKLYDFIAYYYRNLLIRPSLDYHIKKFFKKKSFLLHAGCGSGQVDQNIIKLMKIDALDISINALKIYKINNPEVNDLFHSDIFNSGLKKEKYDGIYNLGVLEHFNEKEINIILTEFKRLIKRKGKILLFWPHKYGLSVIFLKIFTNLIKLVFKKNLNLHPKEITYVKSKDQVSKILKNNGLILEYYYFGMKDMFTQVAILARKNDE